MNGPLKGIKLTYRYPAFLRRLCATVIADVDKKKLSSSQRDIYASTFFRGAAASMKAMVQPNMDAFYKWAEQVTYERILYIVNDPPIRTIVEPSAAAEGQTTPAFEVSPDAEKEVHRKKIKPRKTPAEKPVEWWKKPSAKDTP